MMRRVFVIAGRVLVILLAAGFVTLGMLWWSGQNPQSQSPAHGDTLSTGGSTGHPEGAIPPGGGLRDGTGRGLHGRGVGAGGGGSLAQNLAVIAGITLAVVLIRWIWGLVFQRRAAMLPRT
jgi:hypothetical protein